MQDLIQQAALALGSGATVAIAGQGIVQIYRGSGVLNFAHGAFALAAAEVFVWTWADNGWPLAPALLVSIATGALLGLLTHLLVMRPLRNASQLVRIIATIGVLQVVQQATLLVFGSEAKVVGTFLPTGAVEIGGVNVQKASLVLLAVAVCITAALWLTMRFTLFGIATVAAAENRVLARASGRSPDLLAAGNWALGGALAGLAGVLVVPIGGLAISSILLIAVPAFAAAILGGFRSYTATTVGAVAIAAGQAVYTFEAVQRDWPPGISASIPFLVIVVVLVVRTSAIPGRDEVAARLPRVLRSAPDLRLVGGGIVVGVAVALLSSPRLGDALTTTFLSAIIGLSLVVVTGLSGQISLAQYALAGIGALAAARVSDVHGLPFLVCLAVGVLAAAGGGLLFALPALRARGPTLAVVTLGLGLAVEQGLLADRDVVGGFNGSTPVERPTLFGVAVDAIDHPNRYAAVAVVAFVLLAAMVATLRHGAVGRRLLAVRSNERAAAALGVSVAGVRLYAFSLGAAIAGVGGVLLAFRFDAVPYAQFGLFESLEIVALTLIGGIGSVLGPLVGVLGIPGGLLSYLAEGIGDVARWLVLGAGALLIVVLIWAPDGLVVSVTSRLRRRSRPAPREPATPAAPARPASSPIASPAALTVRGLRVAFGTATVLEGVDLDVGPGQVVGLIGANGAGKTTLIDTVSGFIRHRDGSIRLGTHDLSRQPPHVRAALGVGRCFQSVELFEDLSVRDNLLVGIDRVGPAGWVGGLVRRTGSTLPPQAVAVVDELGLGELLERSPDELSHGQRRLVGVARALVVSPSVLLLDEPAAGLDAGERAHLRRVMTEVAGRGVGVLLVEHDVELVVAVSDRVVAIDFGVPIYDGPPDRVAADPAVRAAYLGATHQPTEGKV